MRRKNRESVEGYFLAGRTMHWIPIGASLFASNIGSEHFVGLAGSGAASGIAVACFELGAVLLLLLLGWVFLPIYLTSQVFTIPEYLGRRFGGYRMRMYLSSVALALYVLTKVSVDVYAGGIFIQQATGWNLYVSMTPLLIITAVYTLVGGLAAVVFTDTFQTGIMLLGAVFLASMAYTKVGGLEALHFKYMEAVAPLGANATATNSTCGLPRTDAFHLFRDPLNSDLPWPGVLARATLASLWYWCADQVIVQRALAAKNMAHAKAATLMAGLLKVTPLFLIIIPGMISRVLFPEEVACVDPGVCRNVCGNPSGCSNIAYPLLILKMAPAGVRGLLMAVMVAALMSSLTSVFNSAATVFTMDMWRKLRPTESEKQLLLVGRLFVVGLVIISVAWIPLIVSFQEGQLFMYIQAVTGYVAPPICSVFLLAIFVPRLNERGAFWGVLAGQATGVTRLILDFLYPAPGCGKEDTRPAIVARVNFTYFSVIVLSVTAVVALLVSFTTHAQPHEQLRGLTWWTLAKGGQPKRDFRLRYVDVSYVIEQEIQTRHGDPQGTSSSQAAEKSRTAEDKTNPRQTFDLDVPSPWRHVLDVCAVLLSCLLLFVFGFFA